MPNPENPGAVEATRRAVLNSGADIGICLDTDVDRSGVVDQMGNGAPQHSRVICSGMTSKRRTPPNAMVSTVRPPLPSPGINRNRYIALMSAITLLDNPGQTIVTDSCTSNGLAQFITALGGRHFRCARAPL